MDYFTSGIDQNLDGNGGPECVHFRSNLRKISESILLSLFAWILLLHYNKHGRRPPVLNKKMQHAGESSWSRTVLVVYCLMFGVEIGYKIASKTMIFLLQPCHVLSAVQIYLLASPLHKHTHLIYRVQMCLMHGPLLAMLFPVTDTLLLPFEVEMYWIQHSALVLTPLYLYFHLQNQSPLKMELHAADVSLSMAVFLIYHVYIVQPIAVATGVNISCMLCPATTDPMYGPNYVLCACAHQTLAIYLSWRLYSTTFTLLDRHPAAVEPADEKSDVNCMKSDVNHNSSQCST